MEDGRLQLQFDDDRSGYKNGVVELEAAEVSECRCSFCFTQDQFVFTVCGALLTVASWHMLFEYQGWREGVLNTVLSLTGLVFFGLSTFFVATGAKRLVLKTKTDSVEVVFYDTLLSCKDGVKNFMECLRQQNPHCRIEY